jgi:hypothetical protein
LQLTPYGAPELCVIFLSIGINDGKRGMKKIRINLVIVLICLMAESIFFSIAVADFSDNWFPESPDIISRIISAADKSDNSDFQSHIIKDGGHTYAYYLKSMNYVGSCKTSFGQVHAAEMFFIRSGYKNGQMPPPRGHPFIVFTDESYKIRDYWRLDMPLMGRRLAFEGTKFFLDDTLLFDYSDLPETNLIIVDGKLHEIPLWKRAKIKKK